MFLLFRCFCYSDVSAIQMFVIQIPTVQLCFTFLRVLWSTPNSWTASCPWWTRLLEKVPKFCSEARSTQSVICTTGRQFWAIWHRKWRLSRKKSLDRLFLSSNSRLKMKLWHLPMQQGNILDVVWDQDSGSGIWNNSGHGLNNRIKVWIAIK